MKVILQIVDGPSQGRQIPMQSGDRVRFGSGDIADVSIPGDAAMSAVHFEVRCGIEQCLVRDLSGAAGVLHNGEATSEFEVTDGDEIVAGQSRFLTRSTDLARLHQTDEAEATEQEVEVLPPSAEELCKITTLSAPALDLFQAEFSPEQYLDVLVDRHLYPDAIEWLAYYLPKNEAVWWCLNGVQSVSVHERRQEENETLAATARWLEDPSESNRRAAMAIAESMNMDNASCYVAASAFYSQGSMAPEGLPDVPPAPTLTGQVVSATLGMVAADGDPATAEQRYLELIRIGKEILSGAFGLPGADPSDNTAKGTESVVT